MYCTEVLLISLLSFINLTLIVFLLVNDILAQIRNDTLAWYKNWLKRSKTWILLLSLLMYLLQFLRNFLQPDLLGLFFNGSLYLCEGLKFLIFVLVFHYFVKQSAALLEQKFAANWTKAIKIMLITTGVIYTLYTF